MKQLTSLLKAIMSQDINLFKYKTRGNSSKAKKVLLPLVLSGIVMYVIGIYLNMIAEELSKINLTYVMLTFSMIIPTIFTLMEGIYKTQGILFETKDNDLLFSLPIEKSKIIIARLIKLYVFQFLFNLLFILPAFVIYIYFENPNIIFYFVSIFISILLPIIPTIVACFIGFIIKDISTKFKSKKVIQTIFTLIALIVLFYISLNMKNIITDMISNATSINEIISNVYYPIGAYINLIQKFDILEFLKLLAINIIPLVVFVMIASKYYFNIISKSLEKRESKKEKNNKNINIKEKSKLLALVSKELKRYFSSTIYMFNTLTGSVLLLIATIGICFDLEGVINFMTEGGIKIDISQIINFIPNIFYGIVVFTACMTSITSSSISLEGKSFNVTRSLPVKSSKILFAKILSSNIISIPLILICDIIFLIFFKTDLLNTINIILISFIMPTFIAIIGLFFNLKYPKMDATSDAEVIKQSKSSTLSVLSGVILAVCLIGFLFLLSDVINIKNIIIIEVVGIGVLDVIFWKALKKYGKRRLKEIE